MIWKTTKVIELEAIVVIQVGDKGKSVSVGHVREKEEFEIYWRDRKAKSHQDTCWRMGYCGQHEFILTCFHSITINSQLLGSLKGNMT